MTIDDKEFHNLSDKQIEKMEEEVLEQKKQVIINHQSDLNIMINLDIALELYIKRFGAVSNVYEKCKDVKIDIMNNIEHTKNHMDKIW